MTVKEIWTDLDFEEMGWHDSAVYAIQFPGEDLVFTLDIDYLFEWVLVPETQQFAFWVAPCSLCFQDVVTLKVDLTFDRAIGLQISDIVRRNPRPSHNGAHTFWQYEIQTDHGNITFESTGYTQRVRRQPVYTDGQCLEPAQRT